MKTALLKNLPVKKHMNMIAASRLWAGLLLCLCAGMMALASSVRARECGDCTMESKSVFAGYNKTGFDAPCDSGPIKHKYLSKRTITSHRYSREIHSGGSFGSQHEYYLQDNNQSYILDFSHLLDHPINPGPNDCRRYELPMHTAWYFTTYGDLSGTWRWNGNGSYDSDLSDDFNALIGCHGTWTDANNPGEVGDYCAMGSGTPPYEAFNHYRNERYTGGTENVATNCDVSSSFSITTYSFHGPANGGTGDEEDVNTFINVLSSEFDDVLLRKCIIALMPSFSDVWTNSIGHAFYSFVDGHTCGSGGKMYYRNKIYNSQKGTVYTVMWPEVTTIAGRNYCTFLTEEITGTGDPVNPAVGKENFVDMPADERDIWEMQPEIISTRSKDDKRPSTPPGQGGNGSGPITGIQG